MADILWLHFSRPRPHWYDASDFERAELLDAWQAEIDKSLQSGAVRTGTWTVRGQSDYSTVEAWLFEDPESMAAHWKRLVGARYAEWFAANNVLGVPPQQASVHAPHITNWPTP